MRDEALEIEKKLVEAWKEEWNGVETYTNMLLYLSFMFAGAGIGTIAVVNNTLVRLTYYPPEVVSALGVATKRTLLICMVGFVSCHIAIYMLTKKFG